MRLGKGPATLAAACHTPGKGHRHADPPVPGKQPQSTRLKQRQSAPLEPSSNCRIVRREKMVVVCKVLPLLSNENDLKSTPL